MKVKTPEILYEDEAVIVCRKEAGVPVQTSKAGHGDMVSALKSYRVRKKGRTLYRADPSPGSAGGRCDGVCQNKSRGGKSVCPGERPSGGKAVSGSSGWNTL